MERTLLILSLVKYVGTFLGLLYTVYVLGSESMRKRRLTLHKATVPFFITFAFIALIAILEWIIVLFVL